MLINLFIATILSYLGVFLGPYIAKRNKEEKNQILPWMLPTITILTVSAFLVLFINVYGRFKGNAVLHIITGILILIAIFYVLKQNKRESKKNLVLSAKKIMGIVPLSYLLINAVLIPSHIILPIIFFLLGYCYSTIICWTEKKIKLRELIKRTYIPYLIILIIAASAYFV